jgi:hypothetical protein
MKDKQARVCVGVDGPDVDNFKAQLAEGFAAGRFEDVKHLVVRNSPVLEGIKAR